MRSLFLLVLLCNILFALWQYTRPGMHSREISAADPGIDRLIMLNELASVEELMVADAGENKPVREAEAVTDEWRKPESLANMVDQPGMAVAVDPEAEAGGQPAPVAQQDQDASPDTEAGVAQAICYRLGPFSSSARAELAENILVQQQLEVDLETEESSEDRYWVLLPAQPSFSEARRVEGLLRQKGVSDLQVLTFAGRKNAISLGVYRNRAIAEARVTKLEQMGYRPQMDVIPRKRSRHWLNIVMNQGNSLSDKVMPEILSIQEVRLEQRQCK